MLSDLHLSEGWLDDRFASGVVGPPLVGPKPSRHPLTLGRVLGDRSPRDGWHAFVVLESACREEHVDLCVGCGLQVALRAVAGIGEDHVGTVVDPGIDQVRVPVLRRLLPEEGARTSVFG